MDVNYMQQDLERSNKQLDLAWEYTKRFRAIKWWVQAQSRRYQAPACHRPSGLPVPTTLLDGLCSVPATQAIREEETHDEEQAC